MKKLNRLKDCLAYRGHYTRGSAESKVEIVESAVS